MAGFQTINKGVRQLSGRKIDGQVRNDIFELQLDEVPHTGCSWIFLQSKVHPMETICPLPLQGFQGLLNNLPVKHAVLGSLVRHQDWYR